MPVSQKLYRVKVVKAFLKAGIPLSKTEPLREILEEYAYRLTNARGMSFIPFVYSQVQQEIKAELSEKYVSVIFDGTARLGEAFAVVVRFVSDKQLKQRLIKFQMLPKSMTGEEIAREVISILQIAYGIGAKQLLACMHYRASVNSCAMQTIKIVFPHIIDVGCYSHTIDLVGEKFDTPILDEFIRLWISLFAHSSLAKMEWRTKTGISMKSCSNTRWWSKWEVCHQVFLLFGDVVPFLKETNASPAPCSKLLQLFSDKRKTEYLQLEIAAVIDAGEPFVKATYQLEGDNALVFRCYEIYSTLEAAVKLQNFPRIFMLWPTSWLADQLNFLTSLYNMGKHGFNQDYNISKQSFLMNCLPVCLPSKLLGFLYQQN